MPTLRFFPKPAVAFKSAIATASALIALAAAPRAAVAQGAATDDAAARALMTSADKGRIQGSDNAKLWIVIFSDFQCPFCKRWHDETDAIVRKNYVETGKAKIAFINFPLSSHAQAQPAAEAAMCASAQGKFWQYHDALFASQTRWTSGSDQGVVFDSLAVAVGADGAAFKSCRSGRKMKLFVENDQVRGAKAGAQGTPHFYIGTQQVSGAIPSSQFTGMIESELAKIKNK